MDKMRKEELRNYDISKMKEITNELDNDSDFQRRIIENYKRISNPGKDLYFDV